MTKWNVIQAAQLLCNSLLKINIFKHTNRKLEECEDYVYRDLYYKSKFTSQYFINMRLFILIYTNNIYCIYQSL